MSAAHRFGWLDIVRLGLVQTALGSLRGWMPDGIRSALVEAR